MNGQLSITKILLIVILLLLISVSVQANNDYKVFLVKDQYLAVDFKDNKNEMHLIFSNGPERLLSRKKSASGIRYNNEDINFWNKGNRVQISINDIIIDGEIKEYSQEISKQFPQLRPDEHIFFKIKGFYIFFLDNEKNNIVISGKDFKINKVSTDRYRGRELEILEDDNNLTLKLGDFKFTAETVNLDNFIKESNLVLKGLGQEPGWLINISPKNIKLELDYAQTILNISEAQYKRYSKKNQICYKIKNSLFNFDIKIIKEVHSDIMSGFKFPFTIKITSEKNTLIGGAYLKQIK